MIADLPRTFADQSKSIVATERTRRLDLEKQPRGLAVNVTDEGNRKREQQVEDRICGKGLESPRDGHQFEI